MLFLLLACTGGDSAADSKSTDTSDTADSGTTAAGPGTLALSFEIDDDLPADMSEPATGTFKGSVYAEADASAVGPNEGAVSLLDFESDPLDFTTTFTSGVAYTSDPIDPQIIWVLGCLDSDANDCDAGDAVTMPNDNKFQVVGDTENALTIQLNIISP